MIKLTGFKKKEKDYMDSCHSKKINLNKYCDETGLNTIAGVFSCAD